MLSRNIRRALIVASALVVSSFSAAHAQDKMAPPAPKMDKTGKMDKMSSPVYVCKSCKMAYSATDAKKMGYKDKMGHKLMKMDKMPAGMKMSGGKMDKMDHMDKMNGGKMDKMSGEKMGHTATKP